MELACTWLDWRYSEAGSFLYAYGVQGVSWEYDEDGDIRITDYIVNHEAYWGMIMTIHSLNHLIEPGLKIDYSVKMEINADIPANLAYFMSTPHDNDYVFPAGVSYTSEQTDTLASSGADLATYVAENYLAFMDGSKPLSDWDSYVAGLNQIGLPEVLEVYQEAYEAYIA